MKRLIAEGLFFFSLVVLYIAARVDEKTTKNNISGMVVGLMEKAK